MTIAGFDKEGGMAFREAIRRRPVRLEFEVDAHAGSGRASRRSKETPMTRTLPALIAAATLAAATAAVPTTAQERCIGCGIGGVEYPAYYEPLPGANCYWFRVPAYDARGNMVGWHGRPEAFCSWLSGYRPWPPR
jgi:hypothetical protein